jgi:hypothetical protein
MLEYLEEYHQKTVEIIGLLGYKSGASRVRLPCRNLFYNLAVI